MAVTKYTKGDIEKASETLTGRIADADITALVASVYAANRNSTDILVAFNAAFHGGSPPVEWGVDFVKAAKAAKKERLEESRAKRSGETPKSPLEKILAEADGRFTELDKLVTATSKSASDAETDASTAGTVAGKIKKYRPLLPDETAALSAARAAAGASRSAADDADVQYDGGSSAFEVVENVKLANGPLAEAQAASNEVEAARVAVSPLSRTAAREAATALRKRQVLDRALTALTDGGPPEEEELSWWRQRRTVAIAAGIALAALVAAWFLEGVPGWVFAPAIITVLIAAAYSVVDIKSSERATNLVMVAALALAGFAFIRGGDGGGSGGDGTNLQFPTVDGSKYTEWAPGTGSADGGLSPIIIIGAIVITAFITLKVRQWLNGRQTP